MQPRIKIEGYILVYVYQVVIVMQDFLLGKSNRKDSVVPLEFSMVLRNGSESQTVLQ